MAREGELASLRAALHRGLAGDVGLVLVVGETGIGKTALVDRLVVEARARSVRVLRGDAEERDCSPFGEPRGERGLRVLAVRHESHLRPERGELRLRRERPRRDGRSDPSRERLCRRDERARRDHRRRHARLSRLQPVVAC
ncbi:MAG: ATP-binding protein [Actinomycetota bacterium]|nr:ATP-binding protein [Actinomycetota bacterium]